jgi:hypothetical protein
MNKQEVAQILAVCSAAYPHVTVTKETALVYSDLLADVDFEVAQRAVRRVIASSQFFPSIAAIREACRDVLVGPSCDPARAWQEVIQRIREVGRAGTPKWSHPHIEAAVTIIGWNDLCGGDNVVALRAHFWRALEAVKNETRAKALRPDIPMLNRP